MKCYIGSRFGVGALFARPAKTLEAASGGLQRKEVQEDARTLLVLEDVTTIEILALPGIPALIRTGRAELVAVRPLTNNSLRILLALAEHGRFRAIAATATIVERGCYNA